MTDPKTGERTRDDKDQLNEPPTPARSGTSGGDMAWDVASRDEERTALGGDPEPTRVTKKDKVQTDTATRSDHQRARD